MIEATCPHCQHRQREAQGAISTYCRSCAHYFLIEKKARRDMVRLPKQTRTVRCFRCKRDSRIAQSALSSQCPHCSAYIDLRDHDVRGSGTETLQTHGSLHFLASARHHSFLVEGGRIVIAGQVEARAAALEELTFERQGVLRGPAEAPRVQVAAAAQARAMNITAETIDIYGRLQANRIEALHQLRVHAGGQLEAQELAAATVWVEAGGQVSATFSSIPRRNLERSFGAFAGKSKPPVNSKAAA